MKELLKAIRTAAAANASLWTACGGRFNYGWAMDKTMPYITYFVVSSVPRRAFRKADDFEDALVQFSLFDDRKGVENIEDLWAKLDAVFDRAALTYATRAHVGCIRQRTGSPERTEDCWMWTTDYRIEFH